MSARLWVSQWGWKVITVAGLALATALPRAQAPAVRVVKVAGEQHKLALLSDGRVVGWRQFRNGQLGPVTAISLSGQFAPAPIAQALPGPAIDVAAGSGTSYALLDDGSVWAWGRGDYGQLGTGPAPDLPLLPSDNPSSEYRGADTPRRVKVGPAAAVAAAENTAFAVLRDGTVWAWGPRGEGLIGDGIPDGRAFDPVQVVDLEDVTAISAVASHVLAVTRSGRVFGWGRNTGGALGHDAIQEPRFDRPVEIAGLSDVVAVAAGLFVSTALKADGTVWVWGSNANGQFGTGVYTSSEVTGSRATPEPVPGVTGVVAIAVGFTGRHTIALLKDGTLRGWGNTDWGQIGANVSGTFQPRPQTPRLTGVAAVFAVGNNSYAVRTDGTFWAWGVGGRQDWPFKTEFNRVPVAVALP